MVETANSRSTDKLPQADDHSIHDMELIERAMPLAFRQEGTNHTTTPANNKGRSAAATTGAWQCSGRQLEGGGNSAISWAMQGYSSRWVSQVAMIFLSVFQPALISFLFNWISVTCTYYATFYWNGRARASFCSKKKDKSCPCWKERSEIWYILYYI